MDSKDIARISKLARIDISGSDRLVADIERMLDGFKRIQAEDLRGFEPMVLPPQCKLSLRQDVAVDGLSKIDAISQAPTTQNGFYLVPKIVGGK
jgi:aspartyl-tRNA(Asn)/glutamyl-tRNA(Gln) amidotransferase subunit C